MIININEEKLLLDHNVKREVNSDKTVSLHLFYGTEKQKTFNIKIIKNDKLLEGVDNEKLNQTASKIALMLLKKELCQENRRFSINSLGFFSKDQQLASHESDDVNKNTERDFKDLSRYLLGEDLFHDEEPSLPNDVPDAIQSPEIDAPYFQEIDEEQKEPEVLSSRLMSDLLVPQKERVEERSVLSPPLVQIARSCHLLFTELHDLCNGDSIKTIRLAKGLIGTLKRKLDIIPERKHSKNPLLLTPSAPEEEYFSALVGLNHTPKNKEKIKKVWTILDSIGVQLYRLSGKNQNNFHSNCKRLLDIADLFVSKMRQTLLSGSGQPALSFSSFLSSGLTSLLPLPPPSNKARASFLLEGLIAKPVLESFLPSFVPFSTACRAVLSTSILNAAWFSNWTGQTTAPLLLEGKKVEKEDQETLSQEISVETEDSHPAKTPDFTFSIEVSPSHQELKSPSLENEQEVVVSRNTNVRERLEEVQLLPTNFLSGSKKKRVNRQKTNKAAQRPTLSPILEKQEPTAAPFDQKFWKKDPVFVQEKPEETKIDLKKRSHVELNPSVKQQTAFQRIAPVVSSIWGLFGKK